MSKSNYNIELIKRFIDKEDAQEYFKATGEVVFPNYKSDNSIVRDEVHCVYETFVRVPSTDMIWYLVPVFWKSIEKKEEDGFRKFLVYVMNIRDKYMAGISDHTYDFKDPNQNRKHEC